ncbi:hypothetical protein Gotri_014886 [Gossypium trilobum]|uniref:Uncharacterized protein n=1 Tax=Gossypium trilobum TaxID=34281 RepID=A0A7J9DY78_9ROSI|nr:hypothetical protein [Gossypium trilobum]
MVCLQHIQDHNQFGNLVSIEFHLFKRDLTFIRLCRICNQFHINSNYTIHIYNIQFKHINMHNLVTRTYIDKCS